MPYIIESDIKTGRTYKKGGPSRKFFSPNKVFGVEMGMITEQVPRRSRREMGSGDLRDYVKTKGANWPKVRNVR